MTNPLLSEYHIWMHGMGNFAVVDTYNQVVLYTDLNLRDAMVKLAELVRLQKGSYPSMVEASQIIDADENIIEGS